MARPLPNKLLIFNTQLIDRIGETNQITRSEHLLLTTAMLSGKNITEEDRRQINRILDAIQSGRVKIIT